VLLFAAGLRTPLLALLAFRRLRNLALVVLPYAPGLALVPLVSPLLTEADRAGLLAVAIAPALLSAPALATAMGGRMDRAGALLAGTIGAAFVLSLVRGGAAGSAMQNGMLGFVLGAGVTSMLPMLPSAPRLVVRRLGDLAFIVLIGIGIVGAPAVGAATALAASALFAATVGAAVLVARIAGVDPRSAIAGAGTRDPAVAVAIAVTIAGPGAAGVPLCSAALLLALGAALVAGNRGKAR
jgi:hypothetical protein